jgi:predicted transcriptional regulator
MGMKWSTALYHIDILKEEGRIRARLYRGRRKYWTLE